MTTFVMLGKYTLEGLKGITAARTKKATALVARCGGKLRSVYALLGGYDVLVVADFPGVKDAMRASILLSKLTGIGFTTSPAVPVGEFDKLA